MDIIGGSPTDRSSSTRSAGSIQAHPQSIRNTPIYLPGHQNQHPVHPSVLTANMIKSGLSVSGTSPKRGGSAWSLFFKLVASMSAVGIPVLALLYFIYYDPLHGLQLSTAASETDERRNSNSIGDQLYKVDSMSAVYVRTKSGQIQGERLEVLNKEIDIFLGLPYAEPPVGDLRFRKPKDVKPWSGTYRAIRHARPCQQYRLGQRLKDHQPIPWESEELSSEDCLYLNIWAPGNSGHRSLKPVLLWINGGVGFLSGSSDIVYYDGGLLASFSDSVVVTFNYRLGIFGFLTASHESAPGNQGLHDQAAAIKWIRANIEAFGGDPERITLFGQSSGASSVGFHLISPITRNLFQRGIVQSGSPLYPQILEDQGFAIDRAQQLAIRVSCANERINIYRHAEDVVSCLRKLEANFLAKAADELFNAGSFHPPFGPTVGNEFLPLNPYEAIKRDEELGTKRKDLLIGTTKDEGSFWLHLTFPSIFSARNPKKVSAQQVLPLVDEAFKFMPPPGSKLVSHLFMNDLNTTDYSLIRQRFYDTIGDFVVTCPLVFFAEQLADRNSSVYMYQFGHRPTSTRWGKWMGVAHFDEVQFVFGTPFLKPQEYSDEERDLSARVMEAWSHFARYGRPPKQLNKVWPEFSSDDRRVMPIEIGNATVIQGPWETRCNMWRFMFENVGR